MAKKSRIAIVLIIVATVLIICYFITGLFVIQPIGAIPDGITIWFIRLGINLPFISSADGLLLKQDSGVSLLGRAMIMSSIIDVIDDKIILRLPYSKLLYSISTNGIQFEE